jgi:hypothetical protein
MPALTARLALVVCALAAGGCQAIFGIGDTSLAASPDAAIPDAPDTPDAAIQDSPVMPDAPDAANPNPDADVPDASVPFTMSVNPTTLRVVAGHAGAMTVNVQPMNGFHGIVSVAFLGLPDGVTADMQTIDTSRMLAQTLTVTVGQTAQTGIYSVQVNATGNGFSTNVDVPLTVAGNPGAIDTSFGSSGLVLTPFGGAGYSAARPIVRPDGHILVGAYGGGSSAIVQVDTHAVSDTSFGGGVGYASVSNFRVADYALQANGGLILIGASVGTTTAFVRFDDSGIIDPGFGGGPRPDAGTAPGEVVDTRGSQALGLAAQSDGSVIYVQTDTTHGGSGVCRLFGDGTFDPSFALGSACYYPPSGTVLTGVALDSSNNIYAGGSHGAPSAFYALQLGPDGAKVHEVSYPMPNNPYTGLAVAPSASSVLIAGTLVESAGGVTYGAMSRNAGDLIDTNFGMAGIVNANLSAQSLTIFKGVASAADGSIVVVGSALFDGRENGVIARYDVHGKLDTNFGQAGSVFVSNTTSLDWVTFDPAGRILVTGEDATTGGVYVARYWN